MSGLLPFDDALARLLASAARVAAERVPLDDAAGRVLAEDVVAPRDQPAFDHSAMDGYAVAAKDVAGPCTLRVVGESAAGGAAPALTPGTACRIFTGAALPEGADAVVPQEDVERRDDEITLRAAPRTRAWVRGRGDDLAAGAAALARGARLGPGQVALAAACDRPQLLVARRPVVSIVASGDELRSPGEPDRPGSIAESNGYFVAAAARAAGAIARVLPFVRDDAEATRAAVAGALAGSDLVVTIGGVSVGDRDFVRPALEAAGVALDFWRVAMKPGKPLAVGRAGAVHVLGLPGNPASASLTFLLFGLPLLRALQGDARPLPPQRRVRVDGSLDRQPGRQEFLRAVAVAPDRARLLANQASGAVTTFAEADTLVVVPSDRARVRDDDELDAIRISDC